MFKWASKLLGLKRTSRITLLVGVFGVAALSSGLVQAQIQIQAQTQTQAQAQNNPQTFQTKSIANKTIESAPTWKSLTAAQQMALKPMQADWASLDANRKQKWLAVAKRYQTMMPADQARMHERMAQWSQLTPAQRSTARDNYSAVLSSPSSSGDASGKGNLNEQWAKYQALSPEKKASLAEQSKKSVDTGKTKPLVTTP